jgi:methylphosphotriester-DNA--protein-cysteine methyltransferase
MTEISKIMIDHSSLGSSQLKALIKNGQIVYAGNRTLKIYGLLSCATGKRMKKENRVFFKNKVDARALGFRPCGHCLRSEYLVWRKKAAFVG